MKPQLFIIIFIIIITTTTTKAADILPGSTLLASNPNSRWSSPNNTFTLSFLQLDPTNQDTYFAAISYNNIIPIWKAGGPVDSLGALRFLSNGNLQLTNGTSNDVVWSSRTANLGVTSAFLDDNGNLVLKNGTFMNIWSSFDNPTDTIVPSQSFNSNHVLRSGVYSFRLRNNGNLSFLWNETIEYYNSGWNSSPSVNLSSPSLRMQPIGILSLNDPSLSSPLNVVYSSDYADEGNILRFLKLDVDGNLRIYSSTQGSGTQNVRWAALTDQCQVFGYCGNFGVCSYNETGPDCGCPSQNFEFNDPNDSRKGCKRKVDLSNCPSNATMLQLDNAKFLTYPPELSEQIFSAGISACRFNCLVNGACVASTSLADGTGMCYIKQPNFVSGYQAPTLPSTSFLKICGPSMPNPTAVSETVEKKNKGKIPGWVVALVVVASLLEETNRKKCSLWAYEEFERGNTEAILDKKLSKQEMNMEQVIQAIQVSFWCIQEQPSQRPTMGKVVQMLEGVVEIDRPPAPRATEGSFAGTSLNASSTSALSTFAASAPAPSSSSSLQTAKNVDRQSSSLLHSEIE
ncbi:hypothetical protein RND71_021244 [Anisodus tanguticus]|uniref:non-specific serine/threonine protein kinase n=1 Tax=Anisodus tanguticus TaxID=243964 RepID=A0AAE1RVP9_9SOLA|nr:hypothetical protein RND71_021244 [Anisodus tanguticus]